MTRTNQSQAITGFHEATLVGISHHGDAFDLTLNDVLIGGRALPASVAIQGVRNVMRDGLPVETISMEKKDGEVLSFRQEGNQVLLVAQ